MKRVVLVTGASSGMGNATAIQLAQSGYIVYAAARRVEKMQNLVSYDISPVAMDLANEASVIACVDKIWGKESRIDILINNAGFGFNGAVEDMSNEDAHQQFEVNVFGAMRLTQLILPKMRENKYGKIVNVTSIGGKLVLPLMGWYCASKFAMEALSDSLRMEVKQFGIDVIIIEPGGIKSEWSGIASENMLRVSGDSVYKNMAVAASKSSDGLDLPGPDVIAKLELKSIEAKNPKARYSAGYNAKMLLFMGKYFPDKLKDKLLLRQLQG